MKEVLKLKDWLEIQKSINQNNPKLEVYTGDVLNIDHVRQVVEGADIVVSLFDGVRLLFAFSLERGLFELHPGNKNCAIVNDKRIFDFIVELHGF